MALASNFAHQGVLAVTLSSAALFNAALPTSVNAAQVAQQKTQVSGYYRMVLGDFEVTASRQRIRM